MFYSNVKKFFRFNYKYEYINISNNSIKTNNISHTSHFSCKYFSSANHKYISSTNHKYINSFDHNYHQFTQHHKINLTTDNATCGENNR